MDSERFRIGPMDDKPVEIPPLQTRINEAIKIIDGFKTEKGDEWIDVLERYRELIDDLRRTLGREP